MVIIIPITFRVSVKLGLLSLHFITSLPFPKKNLKKEIQGDSRSLFVRNFLISQDRINMKIGDGL
jgi:hypothetical protein